jgi:two-component system, chemotaxis family, chemotaxis protein CheY
VTGNAVVRAPHKIRVLVADADADNRAAYVSTFGSAGWETVEAVDGRDALVKALTRTPTLVVAELRLPHIDGAALCQILRRDRTTASVPILIVTDETRAGELNRARSAGASVVLVKPEAAVTIVDEARRLLCRSAVSDRDPAPRPAVHAHRPALSKTHQRMVTTAPPAPPPTLTCPACDRVLAYEQSHIGGVNSRLAEQWDYFRCETCGVFQYRQRTRKLRRI